MGAFSQRLRKTALRLCKQYGEPCVLSKLTPGVYDPDTGETPNTVVTHNTFSVPTNKFNLVFPNNGENTNLAGFETESLIIPYFNDDSFDETWLYNGDNITNITKTSAQDEIIIYEITVGEKS
jgi:hypothetical protein